MEAPVSIIHNFAFKLKGIALPRGNMNIENSIKAFQVDIERSVRRTKSNQRQNITSHELHSIKKLASNRDVTITRSDNGGKVVIISPKKIYDLNIEHLGDALPYESLR